MVSGQKQDFSGSGRVLGVGKVVKDWRVHDGEVLIAVSMMHFEHAVEYVYGGSEEGDEVGKEEGCGGCASVVDRLDRRKRKRKSKETRYDMLRMCGLWGRSPFMFFGKRSFPLVRLVEEK